MEDAYAPDMERKLVKHGPSTFMVSLPKRWVDMHDFSKGDSITYDERPEAVTFFAPERSPEGGSIEVDMSGLDRTSIMFQLRALYRRGFSDITVRFSSPQVMHHRTGKNSRVSSIVLEEVRRLIGIEISSHSKSTIVLKQLAEPTSEELRPSMRRAFFLLKEAYVDLVDALQSKDLVELGSIEEKHDAITKLVSYCLRVLHQTHHEENRPYLMHALMQLDLIVDLLKYFVRDLQARSQSLGKDSIGVLRDIGSLNDLVEKMYFSWDNTVANTFNQRREEAKSDARAASGTEKEHVAYLLPLLEMYRDLVETRMCMTKELFSAEHAR